MEPVDITSTEKEMLEKISEVLGLSVLESDELYYAYKYIKAQGIAAETDIKEITSLGVPLYQALADVKSVSVADIDRLLSSGSITNDDVKNAFIKMTSEGGLFF